MKVYTRRGDKGETDLVGGGRVPKDHLRVEAYGAVDELNAALGVCATATREASLRALLDPVQREHFAVGTYLATPEPRHRESMGMCEPSEAEITWLEEQIDRFERELPPLQRFVLPGGTAASAIFHVARTVCRRAERAVVALSHAEPVAPSVLGYLNRLSDLLFVLARVENRRGGVRDLEWEGRKG
jgi:cob(I)alamin adenosyltransferase